MEDNRSQVNVAELIAERDSLRADCASLRAELEDANYTINKLRAADDKILKRNASVEAELEKVKGERDRMRTEIGCAMNFISEDCVMDAYKTLNAALTPASGNPAGPAGEGR